MKTLAFYLYYRSIYQLWHLLAYKFIVYCLFKEIYVGVTVVAECFTVFWNNQRVNIHAFV